MSDPGGNVPVMPDVTDRQVLEFESKFFRHYGAKAAAIRDELGLTEFGYFQRLRAVLVNPDPALAVEFGPLIDRSGRYWDRTSDRSGVNRVLSR